MEEQLKELSTAALAEIGAASDEASVEAARIKYLGRSGSISAMSEGMKSLSKEEKPRVGKLLNEVRQAVTAALDERKGALQSQADQAALAGMDVTLPGTPVPRGHVHPQSQLMQEAISILRRMGFALADGPDIDTEWTCFDALNTPEDHPARNETDTYYLADGRLLRTHTSTVQIRTMLAQNPPVRIIAPGAAYRRDEMDATHLNQLNQIEGLYVDRKVSVADLKGTLEYLVKELFGIDTKCRLRPHFFPFTEPSFEIDARVKLGGGRERWLELGGCGMVDPAVFEAVNGKRGDRAYDPEAWTGFAFGLGLDRLAMLFSGTPDIRLLIESDVRFLSQF